MGGEYSVLPHMFIYLFYDVTNIFITFAFHFLSFQMTENWIQQTYNLYSKRFLIFVVLPQIIKRIKKSYVFTITTESHGQNKHKNNIKNQTIIYKKKNSETLEARYEKCLMFCTSETKLWKDDRKCVDRTRNRCRN